MAEKNTINLMQPELLPKKPFFTLAKVVAIWGISLVAMLLWSAFNNNQIQSFTVKNNQLKSEQSRLTARQGSLEKELANQKPDQTLVNELATLKFVLTNKESLHQQLTDSTKATVAGFASAMTELSELHHRDVSLSTVYIANNDMTFTGIARDPESVPAWLAGFEESVLLSGKSFVHFKLEENEQNLTEFVVSSIASVEDN